MGQLIRESSIRARLGKKFLIENIYWYEVRKDYSFLSSHGRIYMIPRSCNLVCTQRQCEISKDIIGNSRSMFESRISAGATEKKASSSEKKWVFLRVPTIWKNMSRYVRNVFVKWQTRLLNKFIRYQLHFLMTINSKKKNRNSSEKLSNECSQIILKWLFLSRIQSPDIPWTVNKLTRAITKWVRACDKRLVRLISCIHFTSEYKQYCHLGRIAQKFRLWLFHDFFDTAGSLEDS